MVIILHVYTIFLLSILLLAYMEGFITAKVVLHGQQ